MTGFIGYWNMLEPPTLRNESIPVQKRLTDIQDARAWVSLMDSPIGRTLVYDQIERLIDAIAKSIEGILEDPMTLATRCDLFELGIFEVGTASCASAIAERTVALMVKPQGEEMRREVLHYLRRSADKTTVPFKYWRTLLPPKSPEESTTEAKKRSENAARQWALLMERQMGQNNLPLTQAASDARPTAAFENNFGDREALTNAIAESVRDILEDPTMASTRSTLSDLEVSLAHKSSCAIVAAKCIVDRMAEPCEEETRKEILRYVRERPWLHYALRFPPPIPSDFVSRHFKSRQALRDAIKESLPELSDDVNIAALIPRFARDLLKDKRWPQNDAAEVFVSLLEEPGRRTLQEETLRFIRDRSWLHFALRSPSPWPLTGPDPGKSSEPPPERPDPPPDRPLRSLPALGIEVFGVHFIAKVFTTRDHLVVAVSYEVPSLVDDPAIGPLLPPSSKESMLAKWSRDAHKAAAEEFIALLEQPLRTDLQAKTLRFFEDRIYLHYALNNRPSASETPPTTSTSSTGRAPRTPLLHAQGSASNTGSIVASVEDYKPAQCTPRPENLYGAAPPDQPISPISPKGSATPLPERNSLLQGGTSSAQRLLTSPSDSRANSLRCSDRGCEAARDVVTLPSWSYSDYFNRFGRLVWALSTRMSPLVHDEHVGFYLSAHQKAVYLHPANPNAASAFLNDLVATNSSPLRDAFIGFLDKQNLGHFVRRSLDSRHALPHNVKRLRVSTLPDRISARSAIARSSSRSDLAAPTQQAPMHDNAKPPSRARKAVDAIDPKSAVPDTAKSLRSLAGEGQGPTRRASPYSAAPRSKPAKGPRWR